MPLANTVEIRDFDSSLHSPTEIAAIRHQVRIWQLANHRISESDFQKPQDDLPALENFYVRTGGNFIIAQEDNEIVGFVGIFNEGHNIGRIKRMAVTTEYHRQGIGTKLMIRAISWSKDHDFRQMVLTTGPDEATQEFYEGLGFLKVGVIPDCGDIMMRLDLSTTLILSITSYF